MKEVKKCLIFDMDDNLLYGFDDIDNNQRLKVFVITLQQIKVEGDKVHMKKVSQYGLYTYYRNLEIYHDGTNVVFLNKEALSNYTSTIEKLKYD
jgi:hypothetical protein